MAVSGGLPRLVIRHRGYVLLAWLFAAVVLAPAAGDAERRLAVGAQIPGSESAEVDRILTTRFSSPFAQNAVAVLTGTASAGTEAGRAALEDVARAVATVPGATRTYSALDADDPLFTAAGGANGGSGTFLIVGLDAGPGSVDALVPPLRAALQRVQGELRRRDPEATLRLTGQSVLNFDLRRTTTAEVRVAERRALPLTVGLLLLAFGAVVAALLPVLCGALAIALALGAAVKLTAFGTLSMTLQSIVSMLGLGLGIDYALLMVSRFREALAKGLGSAAAAEEATRHGGHTIVASGASVALGFLGLLLVPVGEIRSVAIGGLLVVVFSVLLSITLLPAALALLGHRVDGGRVLPRRIPGRGAVWERWGGVVTRHPLAIFAVASVPVVALAVQTFRLHADLPRGDWLPRSMESARALQDLRDMGRGAVLQRLRVVLEFPPETFALSEEGWAATRRLAQSLADDPRIARVLSLPAVAGERAEDLTYVSLLPAAAKQSFVSEEGDAALLEAVPGEDVPVHELAAIVRALRRADARALTGLPGARLRVGGLPGFNVDYEDAVKGRFANTVLLVVGGTFLALFVAFRSVLVPLKAVALNLLTVAAAFGAVVLVFQEGRGGWLVGLTEPTGSVFRTVPLYVFCIVFGLSMDYEVFLVSRVAELRRQGHSESAALSRALQHTGSVITSAALIMVAVFASFTLGEVLMMKMLGFALAVAVLLDATVVRIAIGPALLALAGRYNWWPGERGV